MSALLTMMCLKRFGRFVAKRHRMTRTGKSSIFSGMVYCADCGSKMQYGSSNHRDFSQDFFDCSLHKKNGSKCKGHFIRVKVLEGRVLSHVQRVTDLHPLS